MRMLLLLALLFMAAMSLTSCYKQEMGFTAIHHYNQNYNFVVKTDSMIIFENPDTHLRCFMEKHKDRKGEQAPTPYGWTVGLELPTLRTVRETIEILKQEMAG